MKRSIVYIDSIIGALSHRTAQMIEEFGSLEVRLPAAVVIQDVLEAIEVPTAGIRMVLGEDMLAVDDQPDEPLECAYCENPAVGLIKIRQGYRLVCKCCKARAENHSLHVYALPQ